MGQILKSTYVLIGVTTISFLKLFIYFDLGQLIINLLRDNKLIQVKIILFYIIKFMQIFNRWKII